MSIHEQTADLADDLQLSAPLWGDDDLRQLHADTLAERLLRKLPRHYAVQAADILGREDVARAIRATERSAA